MTRTKFLFVPLVVAAIVGVSPAVYAQTPNQLQACLGGIAGCTVHFVGAGSSAQFNPAAIGADILAGVKLAGGPGHSPVYKTATQCVYHWSAKNAAFLVDNRGTVAIPKEPANSWIVWIADLDASTNCPSTATAPISSGNANITDIWMDESVDSTVGNRAFLAQPTLAEEGGSGTLFPGVAVWTVPTAAGNLLGTGAHNLWPDNASDVSILSPNSNLAAAVGTDTAGIKDVHVNAGLTDITPADAYFATTRAMGTYNATTTGLGYKNTAHVGLSILTSEGTGTTATPVSFALYGNDPINTTTPIRPYSIFHLGAAPIVFIYNNNGTDTVLNATTGVTGAGVAGTTGDYFLANLFDGTTSFTVDNPALNGSPAGQAISLFLREPLSGTMNTTEFNLFRTTGNTTDSQEKGVDGKTDNPLGSQPCPSGARCRAIGTGEVIGTSSTGVLGTPHSLGYIFFGFANFAKFSGSGHFNYLTLDGIDPLGMNVNTDGTVAGQSLVNCGGPCPASTYWTGGISFPTIRNGSYKAWSIYRWDVPTYTTDPDPDYGPVALAQATEDNIDDGPNNNGIATSDFVPFATSTGSDGLAVYRSHRAIAGTYNTANKDNDCGTAAGDQTDCNGLPTTANTLDGGYTLGASGSNAVGAVPAGGDVGGLIYGPYGTSYSTGHVDTAATEPCTSKHGYKLSNEGGGDPFPVATGKPGDSGWSGLTITLTDATGAQTNYTVSTSGSATTGVAETATTIYVGGTSTSTTCSGPIPPTSTKGLFYSVNATTALPAGDGTISKKE